MHLPTVRAASIVQVIMINVVLSGDNAIVVGLIASGLPEKQRRRIVAWAGVLAVAMQAAFTLVIARLLRVPGLRLLGGLALLGIACKVIPEDCGAHGSDRPGGFPTTRASVVNMALANLAMSFDNVVAVASVCHSDAIQMCLGLLLSGLLIISLGSLIGEIMARRRQLAYAGSALLAVTAAGMIWDELGGDPVGSASTTMLLGLDLFGGPSMRGLFTGFIVLGCLTFRGWHPALSSIFGRSRSSNWGWTRTIARKPGMDRARRSED